MDPHFNEYLAAIAGMHEVYGDRPDEHPPAIYRNYVALTLSPAEP